MNEIHSEFIKKAKYQKKINKDLTQCLTCERKCKIHKGDTGYCQTRTNFDGDIVSIVYGCIPALSFNPIEKKPLFHFHPGSIAITIGTYGCNFNCFWCQNNHLSHPSHKISDLIMKESKFISPKHLIQNALLHGCQGTSISFNEPTLLFEYSLEVFKLAKKEGLYNTYVSNGYMTEKVLKDLAEGGLDAINIDIKGDNEMVSKYCDADVEKVWRNAVLAKNLGIHVEITTLLIENFNTDKKIIKEISERIERDLGKETPYHLTRFFPLYKSHEYGCNSPTSEVLLLKAYEIAKDGGLQYVYIGNLPTTKYEDTICPNCLKIVIKRRNLEISQKDLNKDGTCKYCGLFICQI